MNSLGTRIRNLRELHSMQQSELAQLVGVRNDVISNWERDVNKPNVDKLILLCKALNTTLAFLLDYSGAEENLSPLERTHIQKYRRLTDNGRATVDQMINTLLEAGQTQAPSEETPDGDGDKRISYPFAALGGGVETKTYSEKDKQAIDDAFAALRIPD